MITLVQEPRRHADSTFHIMFAGLSSDVKPTKVYDRMSIGNCSIFYEIDTASISVYDKTTEQWREQ